MDIRIIDTSVLVNILDIPNMNENHKKAIEEFNKKKTKTAEWTRVN
jgi:predicted nucleic acid-binding protein